MLFSQDKFICEMKPFGRLNEEIYKTVYHYLVCDPIRINNELVRRRAVIRSHRFFIRAAEPLQQPSLLSQVRCNASFYQHQIINLLVIS